MWFQQDGARPHFALLARAVVKWARSCRAAASFSRWIFSRGAIPEDMRQRFTQAFRSINESNQVATVQDSFE
jgi:hypothetical protein